MSGFQGPLQRMQNPCLGRLIHIRAQNCWPTSLHAKVTVDSLLGPPAAAKAPSMGQKTLFDIIDRLKAHWVKASNKWAGFGCYMIVKLAATLPERVQEIDSEALPLDPHGKGMRRASAPKGARNLVSFQGTPNRPSTNPLPRWFLRLPRFGAARSPPCLFAEEVSRLVD